MIHALSFRPVVLGLLAGLTLGLLAGCGYFPDADVLPGGASSLALAPVANETGTGELDVRTQAALRARLLQHAHLRLTGEDSAHLVLRVSLLSFSLTRALDVGEGATRAFGFSLTGSMTLEDRRTGRTWLAAVPVSASASRSHDASVLETPAIRDEGIDAAVDAFAAQVEQRLFQVF